MEEALCHIAEEPEYFEDEELDIFKGRASSEYTDQEAEEFRYVLYTMRQDEVRAWTRSLAMRGIDIPNQLKDEITLLLCNNNG